MRELHSLFIDRPSMAHGCFDIGSPMDLATKLIKVNVG